MNELSSFIATKYIKFKNKDRNISLMMKICFLGISIGTFALMLTLIIMNGFEKVTHEKMQGINSQAIIYSYGKQIDYISIEKFLKDKFDNQINAISPSSTRQVLIDKNNSQTILFIKGINPDTQINVSNINQKILSGPKANLSELITENKIIIGQKMAQSFNLAIGDSLDILIPRQGGKNKIALKKKTLIISGIFNIGLEEYDNNFAFCTLNLLHDLFKENSNAADQINLKFNDPKLNIFQKLINIFIKKDYEKIILHKIQTELTNLTVTSWKELYPALVASLRLEKYVMFFILALITLVACMTMISLLFMYIQQKRHDVAILKSMGFPDNNIRAIFLNIGLKISFWASFTGLLLAFIAGFILERYPFIELPDVYYVSYLPARMDVEIFIVVFIATMFLGFLSTWIPAKRTKNINIAQVLRQE
ncbi:ABC transporter permease [Candidatus Dependentiae bacterium]|nr:ABC transporter permease [Candidatus Dependentiae bacterium]MBU4387102.1 ABC transporter permease [Candidatus Dependentiae bacterium]MCG2756516.1 ABC transporter permease [Candidatus Dependentiae bacterium]